KGPVDAFGRPLLNLRISVTDRCNLRCRYCMPEEEYGWLPREKLLSFEEISELAGIFTEVGIEQVRLTGGEPLLRKDLPVLVRMLAQNPRIRDLALTTNGVLLALDVGGATQWSRSKVVSRAEILDALSRRYGWIAPVVEDSSAPAERFLLADGTVFG